MKKIIAIVIVIVIIIALASVLTAKQGSNPALADEIVVTNIKTNQLVSSPLTIRGEARGKWYFEATFPIVIVDWDGRIIAEGFATADGDWMTTEYVPFNATISFAKPSGDNMRGAIILQKDNPSGLSEHDKALEIPIMFE